MSREKSQSRYFYAGLSNRIKKVRGGLTQGEFANEVGVRQSAISNYESGRIPEVAILEKIAQYGGVTVEWLLKGEEGAGQVSNCLRTQEHIPALYDARPVAPLDLAKLIEVVAAVEDYLNSRKLRRRSIQKARLIALVYEHCTDNKEHPDEILIKRYLPLAD